MTGHVAKYLVASAFCIFGGLGSSHSIAELRLSSSEKVLTFSGAQFGEGPKVELYDDFESDLAPKLGRWQSGGPISRARTTEYVARGSYAMEGYSAETGRARIHRLHFVEPVQEVFISYKVRIGYGESFPARSIEEFGTLPKGSSWKLSWLFDEDVKGNDTDLALPTYVGNGIFLLAGNSHNLERIRDTRDWWSWEGWIRISILIKPNEQNPLLPGKAIFQAESDEKGFFRKTYEVPIFPNNGHYPKQFQKLNIPGWIRNDSDTAVFYDDIYVATGSASQARVEIGENSTYENNSDITILPVSSWKNDKIVADLTDSEVSEYSGKYVFIFNHAGKLVGPPMKIMLNPPEAVRLEVD